MSKKTSSTTSDVFSAPCDYCGEAIFAPEAITVLDAADEEHRQHRVCNRHLSRWLAGINEPAPKPRSGKKQARKKTVEKGGGR